MIKRCHLLILSCLFFVIACPTQASAYIDPGAGSYAFQVFMAGALGLIYTLRSTLASVYFRIKQTFTRKPPHDE